MKIPKHWTFKDDDVASGFDRHVREQLPWYDLTTWIIAHFARHYIPDGGLVYDIGASTGNIGRSIQDTLESRSAKLIAIDNSPNMRDRYRGPGAFIVARAEEYEFKPFDVAILFLSLMFLPVSRRRDFIRRLKRQCRAGGALLIVDRCEPIGGYAGIVLTRLSIAGKMTAGVKADKILEKELSLMGVQRPITKSELGTGCIEIFRVGDFAGWVIEKKSA